MTEGEIHHCERHPQRETELRCNRCGRYACYECVQHTSVGYTCEQCLRGWEDRFYKATSMDYMMVFAVCGALTGLAALAAYQIGLGWILSLGLGFPAGGIIGELALQVTGRRRGRHSETIATLGAIIGGLIGGLSPVVVLYYRIGSPPIDLIEFVAIYGMGVIVFVVMASVTVYGRFQFKI